jgi:hypothetical protein
VPHFELRTQQSAVTALVFALVGLLLPLVVPRRIAGTKRWFPVIVTGAREGAIVMGLFTFWQVAGGLALTRVAGAFDRARDIVAIQKWLPLPTELWVQHAVLPHPDLVRAMNTFYLYVHINSIVIFLVWLFLRHRDRFRWTRNILVLLTGSCLLIQMVPVAPPRMLTDHGFVDTALLYGQSVYGPFGSGIADQLSAMPSVHCGWALLIAYVVIKVSPSRWRWLVLAHPLVTFFVVVGTANHWWLDGIVAGLLLVLAVLVVNVLTARQTRRRSLAAGPAESEESVASARVAR